MIAGIDFGSTLTKAAWKTDKLNYASTADKSLEEIFELLRKDDITKIYATGIGKHEVTKDFKLFTFGGDQIETEVELQAEGTKKLLKLQNTNIEDFLLVSIGTGISYTYVNKDKIERFPIGNSIGGGFFYGLGKFFGAKNFKEMIDLAEKGTSLDLLVKDKLPEKEGTFQGELVIANFGKAESNSKKEDIYSTLLSTIAITITRDVLIREMTDKFQKTPNVVYIGSIVSSSLKLREHLEKYSGLIGKKAYFPEKGEFALALGAHLMGFEEYFEDTK